MADDRTYGFSKVDAEALLQDVTARETVFAELRPRAAQEQAVILDGALAVASSSQTGATSAVAKIQIWSVDDEEYTETEEEVTVWNHSETASYAIDTFGFARFIQGHWVFFGDCEAMADRVGFSSEPPAEP